MLRTEYVPPKARGLYTRVTSASREQPLEFI